MPVLSLLVIPKRPVGITTKKGCTFRCSPSPEKQGYSALLISPAHAFTIQVLRHEFPIDRILQYGLDIIGTSVAIIAVIGMLPHIQRDRKSTRLNSSH